MSLIKPGNGITDIRGTFGGTVFKRDSSGLHATSAPRRVNANPTDAQKNQRAWYASLKRAEVIGEEPETPFEKPRDPAEVSIFSMDYMIAYRSWHLVKPTVINLIAHVEPLPGAVSFLNRFYGQHTILDIPIEPWAIDYVNNSWPGLIDKWGLDADDVARILQNYYEYYNKTCKFSPATSMAKSKELFTKAINEQGAQYSRTIRPKGSSFPINKVGGIIATVALFGSMVLAAVEMFNEDVKGWIRFNRRRVLIEMGDFTCFGSLMGRPSANCLDFLAVGAPAFQGYIIATDYSLGGDYPTSIDPTLLFSAVYSYIGYNYLFRWSTIYSKWNHVAEVIYANTYRMKASPETLDWFGIPVGFYYTAPDVVGYPALLPDYWREWPEEGPRL